MADRSLPKLAIASSFALGGGFSVVSLMTIPSFLLAPPEVAAHQFAEFYKIGYATQPPLTLLTMLMQGVVAYRLPSSVERKYWIASAVFMGAVVLFTFGLMEPVSHRVLAIAGEDGAGGGGGRVGKTSEVMGLLGRWNRLNMVRAVLAVGPGALAFYCQ